MSGKIRLKTHSGASKRFKVTATGKIKRRRAYKSHLLTGKSSKRTRGLRKATFISKEDAKNIKSLLPYNF